MGRENFIRDALHQPNDYVAYYVSHELAALFPDKTILEGRNGEFYLEAFVRDGQCSMVEEKLSFITPPQTGKAATRSKRSKSKTRGSTCSGAVSCSR